MVEVSNEGQKQRFLSIFCVSRSFTTLEASSNLLSHPFPARQCVLEPGARDTVYVRRIIRIIYWAGRVKRENDDSGENTAIVGYRGMSQSVYKGIFFLFFFTLAFTRV